jgi:hypothetical protein
MSEPGFLPSAVVAARQDSLWDKAPAWRSLTVAASLLTLTAVATPLLLPSPADSEHPAQPRAAPVRVAADMPGAPAPSRTALPSPAPSQRSTPPSKTIPKPAKSTAHRAPTPPMRTASLPAHPVTAPQPIQESANTTEHPAAAPSMQTALLPAQPATATQPEATCGITISSQVLPMGGGVVVGYEGTLAARQRLFANERTMGGPINPAFANTPRAIVQTDGSAPDAERQIVVVPPGMTVGIGDHIAFNNLHRDASIPCGYVPPLVTSDSGPSAAKLPVGAGVAP